MSYFSNVLEKLITKRGKAIEFATACGVHQGTISRLQRDKTSPDRDTLERICAILDAPEKAQLVYAYLQDAVPESLRKFVNGRKMGADTDGDELPEVFRQLSPEKQAAMGRLVQLCLEDEELADIILRMVKKLTRDAP